MKLKKTAEMLAITAMAATMALCSCEEKDKYPYFRTVLDHREYPFLYYEEDAVCSNNENKVGGYVTFEVFLWDGGFPDTIIVKFTRNGKFESYVEAVRNGSLEDSLGNTYSPAYVFSSAVGDSWIYDIKGHFVRFEADTIDNDTRDTIYEYKP